MKYQNKKSVCTIALLLLFAAVCLLITACDNIINPAELLRQPDPEDPIPEDPIPEDPIPEDPIPEDPIPEDPIPEDPIPELTDINEMLRVRPDISQPAETGVVMQGIVDDSDPLCPPPLEGYYNKFRKYSAAVGFYQHTCLDPQTDIIWPGSIIEGDTITGGEYVPLTVKRGSMSFSISLVNNDDEQISGFIDEAKFSQLKGQIQSLVSGDMLNSIDQNPNFGIKDIYSEKQMYLAMNAHFPGYAFNPVALFSFDNQDIRTRKLVTVSQAYYTVHVDMPENPGDFFDPEVLWEDIEAQLQGNTSPVYVASVTYGKMACLAIESAVSPEELEAALYYAWTGISGSGDSDIESEYMKILNNATINAVILNGTGNTAVQGVQGFGGFLECIGGSGDFFDAAPEAPLTYMLRYLSDNQVAKVVVCSDYYVRECEKIYTRYRLYIDSVEIQNTPLFTSSGYIKSCIGYYDSGDLEIENHGSFSINNSETIFDTSIDYFFDIDYINNAYFKVITTLQSQILERKIYLSDLDVSGDNGTGLYFCNFLFTNGLMGSVSGRVKFSISPIE